MVIFPHLYKNHDNINSSDSNVGGTDIYDNLIMDKMEHIMIIA